MAEKISSIIDQPVTLSKQDKLSEKDKFGISKYESALTKFIAQAETPLTIALQGEWGSGKTSLMNLLKYHLCEADGAPFYSVWINTWQHSIMSDPENSIINILKSIIYQLGSASGETAEEKKKHISPLIKKTMKIVGVGAANIMGRAAFGVANVGSELYATAQSCGEQNEVPETGDSKIAELRNDIAALISKILAKGKGRKGFLFFIDDLDRIDPPVAVQILELLKNIFDLEHCIYVLAIDYDVVVKGLKPKFGELTDKNAREFRSFFDKIIQLPFAMPVGSYQIDTFLIDVLSRIGYLTPEEQRNDALKQNLSDMAKFSVGTNPRSLKRLTNILSLIQLMTEGMNNNAEGDPQSAEEALIDKQINFGLVCLQITYPLVYNTLLEFPNFRHWGDEKGDPDGMGKTLVKKLSLQELDDAQEKKLKNQGEDFDEAWERILFRICLKDNYLSSRVVDISRLLSKISDIIPMGESLDEKTIEKEHDSLVAKTIERLIRFSAVTNVHATEEPVAAKKIEDFNPSGWLRQYSGKFVPILNSLMGDLNTIECVNSRFRSKIDFRFKKLTESCIRFDGDDAFITIGHDDTSYNVSWRNYVKVLFGGFGSIEEEEQLLGCPGLHDAVIGELKAYAEKYKGTITLNVEDNYHEAKKNGDGQKVGSLMTHAVFRFSTLEDLVKDDAVRQFAEFINGLLHIVFRVAPEAYALCHGRDAQLREQLKNLDIAPFTDMQQWYSQTYLSGYKLNGNSFGISLHLRSNGFRSIIWEGNHDVRRVGDMLKSQPELQKIFSGHRDGDDAWSYPEIIPFDSVIDWLKKLQDLLKRLQ